MTETDLEEKLNENLSYLEHVILGHIHNERHEVGLQSIVTINLFGLMSALQDSITGVGYNSHQVSFIRFFIGIAGVEKICCVGRLDKAVMSLNIFFYCYPFIYKKV